MGNQTCCNDTRNQSAQIQLTKKVQNTLIINPRIQDYIDEKKPFASQLPTNPITVQIGNDTYEGLLDNQSRPQGYGKLYKNNGNLYIGQFQKGQAHGEGVFLFRNGSYYAGKMVFNEAQCQKGQFVSDDITYHGAFKNSKFNGQGKQVGHTHQFKGEYYEGKRKKGIFKWRSVAGNEGYQYTYEGQFDQNEQFTKTGSLKQLKGNYEGNFSKGFKHGYGVYRYRTSGVYKGNYVNGMKQGQGILYNSDGTISYSGLWSEGLPNGQGYVLNQKNQKIYAIWKNGVDERVYEN